MIFTTIMEIMTSTSNTEVTRHFHISVDKGGVVVWYFVSESDIRQLGYFPSLLEAMAIIQAQVEVEGL
jgi:hypothetical protein